MIEYRGGIFGEPEAVSAEFLSRFMDETSAGQAVALHVGTPGELSAVRERRKVEERVSQLDAKMADLDPVQTTLHVPTMEDIKRFALEGA